MTITDTAYCSGILCPLRDRCSRYLPDPPDAILSWILPQYSEKHNNCDFYKPIPQ